MPWEAAEVEAAAKALVEPSHRGSDDSRSNAAGTTCKSRRFLETPRAQRTRQLAQLAQRDHAYARSLGKRGRCGGRIVVLLGSVASTTGGVLGALLTSVAAVGFAVGACSYLVYGGAGRLPDAPELLLVADGVMLMVAARLCRTHVR